MGDQLVRDQFKTERGYWDDQIEFWAMGLHDLTNADQLAKKKTGDQFRVWKCRYSRGDDLAGLAKKLKVLLTGARRYGVGPSALADFGAVASCFGMESRLHALHGNDELVPISGWLIGDTEALFEHRTDEFALQPYYVKPAGLVKAVLDNPSAGPELLEHYVERDWYESYKASEFYDSHTISGEGWPGRYHGYWCWMAVGIARKLDIDDSALSESRYYPYELAHYLDAT